jgi:hypothetical protein
MSGQHELQLLVRCPTPEPIASPLFVQAFLPGNTPPVLAAFSPLGLAYRPAPRQPLTIASSGILAWRERSGSRSAGVWGTANRPPEGGTHDRVSAAFGG